MLISTLGTGLQAGSAKRKLGMLLVFWVGLFCLLIPAIIQPLNLASANFIPPSLPAITIKPDGTIEPTNTTITQTGNVYLLTENITGYYLDIKCSNITVDGAGHTLSGYSANAIWFFNNIGVYNSNDGILLDANGVTVKNVTIELYGDNSILVLGSENTITACTWADCASIAGQYNTVTRNNKIGGVYFNTAGYYNGSVLISQNNELSYNVNSPFAVQLGDQASGNKIFGNNIKSLSTLADAPENFFDNGSIGNYWGTQYNGTDTDNNGIGDTPHNITQTAADHFPFMTQPDLAAAVPPLPQVPPPTQTPTPTPSPTPTPTLTATPTPPETSTPNASDAPATPQPTSTATTSPRNDGLTMQENVLWIVTAAVGVGAVSVGIATWTKKHDQKQLKP